MLILTIILCVILGWELRNIVTALTRRERKHRQEELHRQKIRKQCIWHQIMKIGPKSEEVVCK